MEVKIMKKFFGLGDFLDEQQFLEDQHRQGWKLVKFQGLRKYTFEKVEPKEYIYQLDYKEDNHDDESYIQMFVDCGWEYIMKYQTWYYFRKPKLDMNQQDGEIFSDAESKIEMMKKVVNKTSIIIIAIMFPTYFIVINALDFNHEDIAFIIIRIVCSVIMILILSLNLGIVIKLNKQIQEIQNPLDPQDKD